jgi:polysaccharide export outer membrane protein
MSRSAIAAFAVMVAAGFAGCATMARADQAAPAAFSEATEEYRFYPGDELEITILSAPELSRTLTIAPDGRIDMPLIEPVLAADMTSGELRDSLAAAYARDLRMPEIDVRAHTFGSQLVFVAGEVERPGVYPMVGPIDTIQAVALAGGFRTTARRNQVVIMSREPAGPRTVTVADLRNPRIFEGLNAGPTLRRFDVVYVPRTRISQLNLFVQQYIRDALPINFSLFYDLAQN